MKRLFIASLVAIQSFAGAPALPQEVSAEWAKFQAALKADDLATLSSMIEFPLRCNEFKGDIKSAKSFAEQYKTIFPAPTKQCFATSPLHPQKWNGQIHYEAWCDIGDYPIRFIFKKVGTKLLLTTIDNVNE
jgi:hypothetical protein